MADAIDTANSAVQTSTLNSDKGAFKWLEAFLTPSMFASADSCLLGYGKPIYSSNSQGRDFNVLGFCENISISQGVSVMTLKELRAERTIVIPGKSMPGSITITRLLGDIPNFASKVTGQAGNKWLMSTQGRTMKQLFGLYIVFYTNDRKKELAAMYAERCAIQNHAIGMQNGQFQLFETVNLVFGKLHELT